MNNFEHTLHELQTNGVATDLKLEYKSIGDHEAIKLAKFLETNPTITHLDLSHNDIGSAGMRAIAKALKTNHTMTRLDFSHNLASAYDERRMIQDALIDNKNIIYVNPATRVLREHCEANKTLVRDLVDKMQEKPNSLTIKDIREIEDRLPAIIAVSRNNGMSEREIGKMLIKVRDIASSARITMDIPVYFEKLGADTIKPNIPANKVTTVTIGRPHESNDRHQRG